MTDTRGLQSITGLLGQRLDDAARLTALAGTGLMAAQDDEVFDRLSRLTARILDVPITLVSLVDDSRQHFPSQVGLPDRWARPAEMPLSHSFCQHVVTSGGALIVNDATTDARVAGNLAIDDLSVRAYAGFPLRDDSGNVLGSFCAIDTRPREWSADQLESLADLAATVESEIRSRVALRTSAARVTLLADLTIALHAGLDARTALTALGRRVVPGFAEACIVDLVTGDARESTSAVITARDEGLRELIHRIEARCPRRANPGSAVRRVLDGGRGELITISDDALRRIADTPDDLADYAAVAMSSLVVVPIRSRGAIDGALTLVRTGASTPYDGDDLQLIEEVGQRVGVALDNARLYAREHRTAVTLQHDLLPQLPVVPQLDLAARYLPSGQAARVGGDWYDVLQLPDAAVGIAVGDVAGHDMAAAASMGQLRAVLRSYAWDCTDPGDVLDRACRLIRGLDEDQMATVFFGRLSAPDVDGGRELHYASAGHPPPLLLLPDGSVQPLADAVSPVIGVETEPRSQAAQSLPVGSTLICYTDGLVERRDRDLDEGVAALAAVVARLGADSVDTLAEHVLAAMVPPGGCDDDVALLVIRLR